MAKKDTMPARVFWEPVLWTIAVVSVIVWVIIGAFAGDEQKERDAINKNLRFQEALFHSIVETSGGAATNPVIMSIAAYLREQRGNLDEVLKQERLASSSLTKEQRVMLYMQNPERFPEPLLLMTNAPEWNALRGDAAALATLKKLLSGEMQAAPDVAYDTRALLPQAFLIAWLLVCQFLAFLAYLCCWSIRTEDAQNEVFHWYDLGLPTLACMVFLLPGAAPLLAPMTLVAVGRHLRRQWRDSGSMAHRHGEGLPRAHKDTQSVALLKKLERRVELQKEASDGGLLRK